MVEQRTEVEVVAQAMWEGLKGAHPGDLAALTLEDAARNGIAALDSLRASRQERPQRTAYHCSTHGYVDRSHYPQCPEEGQVRPRETVIDAEEFEEALADPKVAELHARADAYAAGLERPPENVERAAYRRDLLATASPDELRCEIRRLDKLLAERPPGDSAYDPRAAMRAALRASTRVRDGRWIRGAPSHVLADFLAELHRNGWELHRERPPGDREADEDLQPPDGLTLEQRGEWVLAKLHERVEDHWRRHRQDYLYILPDREQHTD